MITAEDFRRIAYGLPGAEEKGHMGHPDFRVGGKIFATLGYPDPGWGMVKLTPEEQRVYVAQIAVDFSSTRSGVELFFGGSALAAANCFERGAACRSSRYQGATGALALAKTSA